jgi:preprotein translocase subunit SecA
MKDEVRRIVDLHTAGGISEWNKAEIEGGFKSILGRDEAPVFKIDWEKYDNSEHLKKDLYELLEKLYEDHEQKIGSEVMRQIERAIYLRSIDTLWVEHLTTMEELREGIGLRGYGQRDPLVEYKAEAYRLFQVLQASIADQVIHMVFKVELAVQPPQIAQRAAQNIEEKGASEQDAAGTFAGERGAVSERAASSAIGETNAQRAMRAESNRASVKSEKVGRNDPCPCGSGKKYKKCCGR